MNTYRITVVMPNGSTLYFDVEAEGAYLTLWDDFVVFAHAVGGQFDGFELVDRA